MAITLPSGQQDAQIRELSRAEGYQLLDARARHYLHISGAEFLERWRRGEYRDVDRPEVLRVVMALPFVRE